MAAITVEQRILRDFDCSVDELLASFANEGMTSKQVAEKLECGVSNVRRIARKYNIRFNQPAPQSKIIHDEKFKDPNLNTVNFLSRPWKHRIHRMLDSSEKSLLNTAMEAVEEVA